MSEQKNESLNSFSYFTDCLQIYQMIDFWFCDSQVFINNIPLIHIDSLNIVQAATQFFRTEFAFWWYVWNTNSTRKNM